MREFEVTTRREGPFLIERTTPTGWKARLLRLFGPTRVVDIPTVGVADARQVTLGRGERIRVIEIATDRDVLDYRNPS